MRKTIYCLIGLNILLAGYLCIALSQRGTPKRQAVSEPAPVTAEAIRVALARKTQAKAHAEDETWASLVSADLRRYAANLRRVGCPEQTIKDIMLAEVNRLYKPRESALKARPDDIAPWEKQASYSRHSSETKLRQLLEEKRALLKELAGVDVGIDMPNRLAGRDQTKFEGAFGALPETKRDQVRAIQENYWAQSDDIKQRTVGYLEPEDRDEFQRIKRERIDELSKVLTPRELQDYEMATSDLTPKLKSKLQGVNVTDEEMRTLFSYVDPLDDQYSLNRRNPDPLDTEFTAARTKAEKDVEQYVHTVLGDDRYAEYERLRDPVYKEISKAGTEAGLPQESILAAYQAQQQIRDSSQRLMADPNLTPEQRAQGFSEIQAQAQEKMQQLFGDKAAQMLKRIPDMRLAQRYGLLVPGVQGDANPQPRVIVTTP